MWQWSGVKEIKIGFRLTATDSVDTTKVISLDVHRNNMNAGYITDVFAKKVAGINGKVSDETAKLAEMVAGIDISKIGTIPAPVISSEVGG